MKVTLDNGGLFTLTAENKDDNAVLFAVTNGSGKLNEIQFHFSEKQHTVGSKIKNLFITKPEGLVPVEEPDTHKVEVKEKRTYNKTGKYSVRTTKPHQIRRKYAKACPVEGCEYKGTGIEIHKRMSHGIQADGEIVSSFNMSNRHGGGSVVKDVSKPVVKLPNGTYRLLPKQQDTKTFLD